MWKELFVFGMNVTLPGAAGTVFTPTQIRIDSDADFEWQKNAYVSTSPLIKLRFRDDSMGRYLTKNPVDIQGIAGNLIGTPFIWGRPYVILAGTTFTVEASDYSTAPNTLRFAMHGAKMRPGNSPWDRRFRALIPFVYSTGAVTIPASASLPVNIEVDMDAHFLVQKISGIRTGACLVEFKEASRDRDWQNIPVHFDSMVGNGQFPNVVFSNRFIYRGSVIVVNFTDLSAAPNPVEVMITGVKLYE